MPRPKLPPVTRLEMTPSTIPPAAFAADAAAWVRQAAEMNSAEPTKALYERVNDTSLSVLDRKRVRRAAEAILRTQRDEPYGPVAPRPYRGRSWEHSR